jgi:2-polyprenyl-6-methoxyphenol hydroxylase-like FAD-dependent oxidoreductase
MHVLISGAGIAGPALAFWLVRAGHAVTVVERAPAPRPGGQAVDLRGTAREVADRMGLLDTIRAASLRTSAFATVDAEIEILRGDLAALLRAATPEVEYVFGDRVTALAQDPAGVDVELARGAPRRVDAVVGADGVQSGVRALLVGDVRRHVHPLGTVLAYWSAPDHLGLTDEALSHTDAGREVGIRPVPGTGRVIVYLAAPAPPPALGLSAAAQKAAVRELGAGMGWEVPRLLADLDGVEDLYLDGCSQVILDRWSHGRIVLLGDAAHSPSPMSGQGTSLALVDAYVLAVELDQDPTTAGEAYERRLRPWVERTQQLAHDPTDLAEVANAFRL